MLIAIILISLIARAKGPTVKIRVIPCGEQCGTTLKLCDEALTACELQIKFQQELIMTQEELITKLAEQRNEAYDKLGSIEATTPWYIWGIVGLSAGVVLGGTVIFK